MIRLSPGRPAADEVGRLRKDGPTIGAPHSHESAYGLPELNQAPSTRHATQSQTNHAAQSPNIHDNNPRNQRISWGRFGVPCH